MEAVRMALKDVDFRWVEVRRINCYALFMAYLFMAARGAGFLVITWSTVVLLGGFVSDLGKKDFWCLTIITFLIIPRVSADVGLKEKLIYIGCSFNGMYFAILGVLDPKNSSSLLYWPRGLLAVVVWLCHLLVVPIVVAVVVCPLAALYVCGPLLTAGISMWRLIKHDYGDVMKEHLEPALIILYTLAIFHGSLCCYRFYSSFAQKRLVHDMAEAYNMSNDDEKDLVMGYLRETVTKCEKDPTFFKETNLATYAVGMIKSESSESFLIGARILDALLKHFLRKQHGLTTEDTKELTAQLVYLASSSHVHEKLQQAQDSTSPQAQDVANNIVAHLAQLRSQISSHKEAIHGMDGIRFAN